MVERYQPDFNIGLTDYQVRERMAAGCTNEEAESSSVTVGDIIRENVFTYFNLIFTVLAVLLCIVGSFRDLTFLPIIIANTLIGIIQEVRAKKTLDSLNMLNAPQAVVVRDGKEMTVAAEALVLDDIVKFRAGNQVCADAVICSGEVHVNEALLTGEADEISKAEGGALMSGSFIVSGECYARLDKVGADSYISQLTAQAKVQQRGEQSEMIRSLNKLVKAVGIAIIPIGAVIFSLAFFVHDESFKSSVTGMVAAVIGMIPEGLYLLASIALAVSTMRLARKKVLLHDMKCIETLARVDVLCVDKTGTITENTMRVQGLVPTDNYDGKSMEPLDIMLGDFAAAMSNDNTTMAAVKEYFTATSGKPPKRKTGFSSVSKYSSVTFGDETYVLGAPEFVLNGKYSEYEDEISEYTSSGVRVLVFGTTAEQVDGSRLEEGINPLGFVLLANPIREGAASTFAYFAEQGVAIKVISGDNPVTVSRVAMKAGIQGAEKYVDASTLTDGAQMREAILNNTVFGRVTPDQKRRFVKILKSAGHTVAMTGDGVNDILALKDADCSIAMASGSEAAAQTAQLVLLESDFSCMPHVVWEGRRVVNNIQRSASLFLVKNIFSFLLSLVSVIFMFAYPLVPSQVSLVSMFTIGMPAFFLAMEPNKNIIKGHFLTNVFLKALPAGLTDALVVGAIVIFGRTFGLNEDEVSTAATMLLAMVGLIILYRISVPVNKYRAVIMAGSLAALILSSIFLGRLFAITGMSKKCIMLFVIFAIATEPVIRYITLIIEKIRALYQSRKNAV